LDKLSIPFVIRTDNDVIKKVNKKYYYAGILRLLKIHETYYYKSEEDVIDNPFKDLNKKTLDSQLIKQFQDTKHKLESCNLFLSNKDLENDLLNSKICKQLLERSGCNSKSELLKEMCKSKATTMFNLLNMGIDLSPLIKSDLFKPIVAAVTLVSKSE
jgi:putative ATP-dependent endonuclease of OLD family